MNCEQYDELLDDYVDGARAADRPGDDRRGSFERHLAACARCQALVTDFTSIRRAASMLDGHVPPARLWTAIESAIESQPGRFEGWVPLAIAASLAALLAGGTWMAWQHSIGDASPPGDTIAVR